MKQLSLILLLACAACKAGGPAPSSTVPAVLAAVAPAAANDLPAQMRAQIGNAACTDSAQCKTVPLGARACGGPEGYLAYSAAKTPAAPLLALAERYAQQRSAEQAAAGMASTCQMAVDPGAVCQAGACQLGTGQPGAT
ncbi:hypothetical protein CR105_12670 [Massilia eurypsychrophila]|jgi:hypothetical protein|uniref:DUF4189 domain-containing protein n=1 Tax=Massilia eurypsychrophila TaxID=1485217 RepID=A0A2G8TFP9_9BURK|nr:hypothetical protein [Massilia eurypsychrophila]PIL44759.1 hypothetical protein CR105_12670 [Massilia eurypsychrophila]